VFYSLLYRSLIARTVEADAEVTHKVDTTGAVEKLRALVEAARAAQARRIEPPPPIDATATDVAPDALPGAARSSL
jgi:hypothetical protein